MVNSAPGHPTSYPYVLTQFRESQNISQGDIEERMELLRFYVSRVENGHILLPA